jgi:hypothetical protein
MGLREALEKRKGVSIGVSAILVLAAIAIIFNETRSNQMTRIDRAFYSDDDGQTYFVDEVDKLVPFDHNGKQAYRAYFLNAAAENNSWDMFRVFRIAHGQSCRN